tara:strand:- start:316 stop:522 length:207 start_codon:yes stop_codon:yes gene_type:complete
MWIHAVPLFHLLVIQKPNIKKPLHQQPVIANVNIWKIVTYPNREMRKNAPQPLSSAAVTNTLSWGTSR